MRILLAIDFVLSVLGLILSGFMLSTLFSKRIGMTGSVFGPVFFVVASAMFLGLQWHTIAEEPHLRMLNILWFLLHALCHTAQYFSCKDTVILGKDHIYRITEYLLPKGYTYDQVRSYGSRSEIYISRHDRHRTKEINYRFVFRFTDGKTGSFWIGRPKNRKAEYCKAIMRAHRQARKAARQAEK